MWRAQCLRTLTNMARQPPVAPIIAVVGATGTGKSQLAVTLAKHYNGEIINGDAMQLYDGLSVITNKMTLEEQQGIPHHLLGCIGLGEQTWVVGTFVSKALKTVQEIRSRGKLPILVGGTHYYTQSLLFQDRLATSEGKLEGKPDFVQDMEARWPILRASTDDLLAELRRVDPVMADRWHPNDRRKIKRSLEIYLQTGRRASEVYNEQRHRQNGSNTDEETRLLAGGPPLRFPTLLFWVHASDDELRPRLDKRVDKMILDGLLEEVQILDAFAESQDLVGRPIDQSKGIWISIGYKEFKQYSRALQRGDASEQELERLKAAALDLTKIATRQYAKQQVRWIRIKLVNALRAADAQHSLFLLDGSDYEGFHSNVEIPALEFTRSFLQGGSLPEPATLSSVAAAMLTPKRDFEFSSAPEKWVREHCETCNVTCVTQEQWQMHIKSKAHRKLTSKANNRDA